MEIKTCEEYVLNQLNLVQAENEALKKRVEYLEMINKELKGSKTSVDEKYETLQDLISTTNKKLIRVEDGDIRHMDRLELYSLVDKNKVITLWDNEVETVFLDITDGRTYEFNKESNEIHLRPYWETPIE